MFKDSKVKLPGVDEFVARQICIPVGWWLKDKEVRYIIDTVLKFDAAV
jgi:dTDP-4-amino-4,6-dideoxygalactose transaminase